MGIPPLLPKTIVSLPPAMTPIPLDELAESTPLNAPIRPSFNTTTIPLSLDATVEPSPVTLGVISSERSGLGTLILTAIAVAISVAVIVQGIVIWKSRRFRSKLTLLVFLANDVLGRQADSSQQGAAGQPVASSSHLKNPSPSRRQAASPPHQQGATTPGQEVTPPPRRRNVSRRSGLRLAKFIKHTKSILHLGKRAPPPRQDTPSEQSAPNEQDTPGEQGGSNGQGGSGGPGGSGGQAATDTLPARSETDLEAIHR